MTIPHHDDPMGEGLSTVLRALAVLATVGEAGARFAVTGARDRPWKAERHVATDHVAIAAHEQASRATQLSYAAQQHADRELMDGTFSDAWLAAADLDAAANLWRTASVYAMGGDQRAAVAMRRAQDRLAALNPGLVQAYLRHTKAGMTVADAMRAAAHDVWQHQTRPPGVRSRGSGELVDHATVAPATGGRDIGSAADTRDRAWGDELDFAAIAEIARLALGVDRAELERLQRRWRSAGHASAADTAERLASVAGERQSHGDMVGGAGQDIGAQDVDSKSRPVRQSPVTAGTTPHDELGPPLEPGRDQASAPKDSNPVVAADARTHQPAADTPDRASGVGPGYSDGPAASGTNASEPVHEASEQRGRLSRAFPPLVPRRSRPRDPAPTNASSGSRRKGRSR
jgi:hypothetical protein